MKIYLDDDLEYRPTPEGWERARNFSEFQQLIETARERKESIDAISFDNDLGEGEKEGYRVMQWLGENYPEYLVGETEITIHTANPEGRDNMNAYLDWARKNPEEIREMKNRKHPFGDIEGE